MIPRKRKKSRLTTTKMTSRTSHEELGRTVRGALEGGRRVRRYLFSPNGLAMLITHGQKFLVTNGVPQGCVTKGVTIDHNTNQVALWLEHESFAVIPAGGICPDGPIPEFKRI